jgi:hypothetical protein
VKNRDRAMDVLTLAAHNASISSPNCSRLARALAGDAPDAVLDAFIHRSTADQALWEAAAQRAAQRVAHAPRLPLEPTRTPAYRWVMHKPPALRSIKERRDAAASNRSDAFESLSTLPWWDTFRVVPAGSNLTVNVSVCRREPCRVVGYHCL